MRDQRLKLGQLLHTLRQKFPYNLKEWAMLFETDPATIRQIEQGENVAVPWEFWETLVKWVMSTCGEAAASDNTPEQLLDLLRDLHQQHLRIKQLEQVIDTQSQQIDFEAKAKEWHKKQIDFYKTIIDNQKQQIEKLTQQQATNNRTATGTVEGKATGRVIMD